MVHDYYIYYLTPGSTMSFNYAGVNGGALGLVQGCTVWYTYYDIK